MRILVLNGSPKKTGTVASVLRAVVDEAGESCEVEWVDVYELSMRMCSACMKCRPDGKCVYPEDDAHRISEMIGAADALVIGTPTYWGNMSSALKVLFERSVPVIMEEVPNGFPIGKQKGKPAVVVTACSTPWPINFILPESRGAINAVREVLRYGGYRFVGAVVRPGSRDKTEVPKKLLDKARRLGRRLSRLR